VETARDTLGQGSRVQSVQRLLQHAVQRTRGHPDPGLSSAI